MCLQYAMGYSVPQMRDNARAVQSGTSATSLRPELPRSAPQGIKDLICACWQHHPHARPTIYEVVDHLTDMVASGAPAGGSCVSTLRPALSGSGWLCRWLRSRVAAART